MPFNNSSSDIQLYRKVSAICVKLFVFRETNSPASNLHILKWMGKAGRQEGCAEKEKESDINQEREVKHILTGLNTETHTKEMKYALNGQFIFSGKNLLSSEWVEILKRKKRALGRCHTFQIRAKMLRVIKMGLQNRQMRTTDKFTYEDELPMLDELFVKCFRICVF